jgi:hypothetical protein
MAKWLDPVERYALAWEYSMLKDSCWRVSTRRPLNAISGNLRAPWISLKDKARAWIVQFLANRCIRPEIRPDRAQARERFMVFQDHGFCLICRAARL